MQTADCRLQTGYKMQTRYKMQTETKTVSSPNTGYIFNFQLTLVSRNRISEIISHEIDLIFDPFLNSLFSLSRFGSFLFPEVLSSQRRLAFNRFALVRKQFINTPMFSYYNEVNRLDFRGGKQLKSTDFN